MQIDWCKQDIKLNICSSEILKIEVLINMLIVT